MINKKVIFISSVLAGILMLSSCSGGGGESSSTVETSTLPATIKHINASRTIVYEGDTTVLSAVVYNGSAEDYEFYWQASEGYFSNSYSQNTTYTAPSTDTNKYVNIYVSIKSKESGVVSYGAMTMSIKDGDAIGSGGTSGGDNGGGSNSSNDSSSSSSSSSDGNGGGGGLPGCVLGKGTYCTDGCLDSNFIWRKSSDTIDTNGIYDEYVRIFARLHSPQNINDGLTAVEIWWPTNGVTSTKKAFPDLFLQNHRNQENAYVTYSTDLFGKDFYFQYFDMENGDVYCEKGTFPSTDFGFIPDNSTKPDTDAITTQ